MNHFLKISQQTIWQILGKGVTSLSTFVILGIVARNYGEQGTGTFTLALTYLAIFYLLADFGFNAHVLTREKGQGERVKEGWNELLGTRIVWSGILVILAIGTLPFWPFANANFSQAVLFGSLAIVGSAIFITCNLIFQSKLRYDLSTLAVSIGTLISLGVFVFLGQQKLPISYLLLAHLAGWLIIAATSLLITKNFLPKISPVFSLAYIKNLFQDSWPIAATLALNVVYFRADSFMIAFYKGTADVGIYNIAYSVFQSALVIPTFIMNAYYPMMLKSLKGIKFVGLSLLGLAILGTFTTLFLAPVIIKLLTGGGFVGSVESLQILCFGFPGYFVSSLLMWRLVSQGSYKLMLIIYALGLIFNLGLNLIFIPEYSFLAASWTTVISEYIIVLVQFMALISDRYKEDAFI